YTTLFRSKLRGCGRRPRSRFGPNRTQKLRGYGGGRGDRQDREGARQRRGEPRRATDRERRGGASAAAPRGASLRPGRNAVRRRAAGAFRRAAARGAPL